MKKLLSVLLSIVISLSFATNGIIAFADACGCCFYCWENDDCDCGCADCFYCSINEGDDGDNGDDEIDEGDDGDEGGNEDSSSTPIDEGTDPVEADTVYTTDQMKQDIAHISSKNFCGNSLAWYIMNGTLYIFGSGEMDDFTYENPAPWKNLSFSSVEFHNGITYIGTRAFDSTKVKSVKLVSTIREIGDEAFKNCTQLRSIEFNKGLESVGTYAFYNCSEMRTATLNNTLLDMGYGCFMKCTSLTNVRFPKTLRRIESSAFSGCSSLKRLVLREGLNVIDSYAFENCSQLSSIQFPTTLTSVNTCAFYNCRLLSELDMSNSVTDIGSCAFSYCTSLKRVNFGKLVYLGSYAFDNSGLEQITVSSSLSSIESTALSNCSRIQVDVVKNATAYKAFKAMKNVDVVCKTHDDRTTTVIKATTSADGRSGGSICSACGYETSVKTIPRIANITISKTSSTYNAKAQIPTVKVTDRTGATISSSNYSVTTSSGFKNVGSYSVKVTFKNNYSGTKSFTYTINPASTSISSLTATSKGFKAVWKKQATQTTGYEIQYSTSSSFSSAKTVTVSSTSTTSKSVSKLSAKKKYYVRVRTYKTVNSKKYYSSWSSVKSITTKA